ncbi:MAG TPA: thioredoxin-disulfide reductase [Acidimicrobiales bacterium]|nr:thioredoxin-disulfide reductase [Acidimicrobiales bacterium]
MSDGQNGQDQQHVRDVIIVGSGPAGLTAAIYTARANLHPLVIEGELSSTSDQPGGQLMLTTEVENYPGFEKGIQGPELMAAFRAQAARFGTDLLTAKVSKVDFSERPFRVWVGDDEYRANTVIVSTGARALMLGLEAEKRLMGHGLSTCATCDGFFFQGEDIAIVGGGDSALEEAIFLTKFADKVTVIHRRDSLRASKIMQERAFKNDKIEFMWDSVVVDLLGDSRLTGARVRNVKTHEETEIKVGGFFVAIGHVPNTALFEGKLDMDEGGYIRTHDGTRTTVDGVFACGDVQDHVYRQAITAAGTGCMAAIDAERWLESQPEPEAEPPGDAHDRAVGAASSP